jgi:hypothetical protein
MVLVATGCALFAVMIWVAATAADEQEQRERRRRRHETLRDLDLKRGRHPWAPSSSKHSLPPRWSNWRVSSIERHRRKEWVMTRLTAAVRATNKASMPGTIALPFRSFVFWCRWRGGSGVGLVRPDVLLDARISRTYHDIALAVWDLDWLILIHILLVKLVFPPVRHGANHPSHIRFLSDSRTARYQPWIDDDRATRRALLGADNKTGITDLKGGNGQECERWVSSDIAVHAQTPTSTDRARQPKTAKKFSPARMRVMFSVAAFGQVSAAVSERPSRRPFRRLA